VLRNNSETLAVYRYHEQRNRLARLERWPKAFDTF
jgi:hypothetical protein